jgi:hypothetical protein
LIDAGLIWQYELHDCEPFTGNCVITQCFKCYQYGHVGHHCHNTQRCGFCAAPGHNTNDCLGKEEKAMHRCVLCKGNHPSWARECPERVKQAELAKAAYNTRPVRYQTSLGFAQQPRQYTQARTPARTQESPHTSPQLEEPTITAVNNLPPNLEQEPQIEPQTVSASNPPAKRGPGRPRGSKNTKDSRTIPSTQ